MNQKTKKILWYVIFSFLIALQGCKSTKVADPNSSGLMDSEDEGVDLIHAQMAVNGKFPQINTGIVIGMASAFLNSSMSAAAFAAKPTQADIDQLGKAMNAFHATNHIDVKYNSPSKKTVNADRLRGLILGERTRAMIEIRKAISAIQGGTPIFGSPWNESPDNTALNDGLRMQLAADIDKARQHPRYGAILKQFGRALAKASESEEVKSISIKYKEFLKSRGAGASAPEKLSWGVAINKAFRNQLKIAINQEFPSSLSSSEKFFLLEAFIWDRYHGYE